jgi:uncharacterized membrane protein YkvA (DUF1232 family)
VKWLLSLRERARFLKRDAMALYLAARDPRTPWMAKLVVLAIVAYVISPIDLIPDFIPVLGYLDEVILVPIAISFALKMVPANVLSEARERAPQAFKRGTRIALIGAASIIGLWILVAWFVIRAGMALFAELR